MLFDTINPFLNGVREKRYVAKQNCIAYSCLNTGINELSKFTVEIDYSPKLSRAIGVIICFQFASE